MTHFELSSWVHNNKNITTFFEYSTERTFFNIYLSYLLVFLCALRRLFEHGKHVSWQLIDGFEIRCEPISRFVPTYWIPVGSKLITIFVPFLKKEFANLAKIDVNQLSRDWNWRCINSSQAGGVLCSKLDHRPPAFPCIYRPCPWRCFQHWNEKSVEKGFKLRGQYEEKKENYGESDIWKIPCSVSAVSSSQSAE